MILDEISSAIDSLSRDAVRELVLSLGIGGIGGRRIPAILKSLAPKLDQDDRIVVENMKKLGGFFISGAGGTGMGGMGGMGGTQPFDPSRLLTLTMKSETRQKIVQMMPVLREFSPSIVSFGQLVVRRLVDKSTGRVLQASAKAIFG